MDFERLVSKKALESESWPSYVLDRDGRILYVNRAWDRVASQWGGPTSRGVIGTLWLDHISGVELRAAYSKMFESLLLRTSDNGILQTYECNTPERWRSFAARFLPLRERRATDVSYVVAVSNLIDDRPVTEHYEVGPPEEAKYIASSGLITQCGGCRRLRAVASPHPWVFVPAFVTSARRDVSHGLCALCQEACYGVREDRAPT